MLLGCDSTDRYFYADLQSESSGIIRVVADDVVHKMSLKLFDDPQIFPLSESQAAVMPDDNHIIFALSGNAATQEACYELFLFN